MKIQFIMVVLVFLFISCSKHVNKVNTGLYEKVEAYGREKLKVATLAGGCFWCIESAYEGNEGIIEAISGYTGGHKENPTYEEVIAGGTGHLEAAQIYYDPKKISYKEILDIFWIQIDPTDAGGQFSDRGEQYKTAIFYHDEEQKKIALKSKENIATKFESPIVTKVLPLKKFYVAESYHQDYHIKAASRYNVYKKLSGREKNIKENEERLGSQKEYLKEKLTPLQYKVTQEDGTERPFENEYWDNKEEGIYVDIISGEPLFSSKDKFESGTGWPSFTEPLVSENIVEKKDFKLIVPRTEVRSKVADSHLGHVFEDGPEPTGQRYCINSAALKFIPKDKLKEEGYEKYIKEFE